ncbi:MAG: integration host factor subunit beta [Gammaproteobacteria bacterium]|nr:integration host factor subunit beta [Gammaproteobacteria bacterium]MCY4198215.1 integration host factor subunit beta [Gammaproteobacteria bacterium]MCY4277337.1 integration host factor subunit beta [Gammaproteobacteria bacterium]MCY4323575.1 integration host factor subunit beta [Gammaproteobacteria bacterium]
MPVKRSELIRRLARRHKDFSASDIEAVVMHLIEVMSAALEEGRRIEVRGFGSISLRERPSRLGRNPRTGEPVALPVRYIPFFKPGKALRKRVDSAAET